jgi:ATP-dependent DNA helicase RecG
MKSAAELLEALNAHDEGQRLEAKLSKEVGKSILTTICAFANCDGGEILCGVRRVRGNLFGSYVVEGIDEPDKLQSDILNACNAQTFNRPVDVTSDVFELDNKSVVVFSVPPRIPHPCHLYFSKEQYPRGVYLRRGPTDRQCTDEDIPLLQQEQLRFSFDCSVVENANLDQIDSSLVRQFRDLRFRNHFNPADQDLPEKQFLQRLSCLVESKGRDCPTAAGILLFGSGHAIRQHFPNARFEYARVPSIDLVPDPGLQPLHERKTFEGPLMITINEVIRWLLDDLPLESTFSDGLQRQDHPIIRDRIARELVVNAVCHRSYLETGPIEITRYSNRIVVQNPGHSLVPVHRLGSLISKCRNEKIAAALRDVGWADTRGTGIGYVKSRLDQLGFMPPVFESDPEGGIFRATLLLKRFPKATFSGSPFEPQIDRILFLCWEMQSVNVSCCQSIVEDDEDMARGYLRELLDAGLISEAGGRANRHYVPTPDSHSLFSELCSDSTVKQSDSTGSVKYSTGKTAESVSLSVFRGDAEGSISSQMSELPSEIRELVAGLGERSTPENVVRVMLSLCRWKSLGATELAIYMNRSKVWVREQYVAGLLEKRMLELDGDKNSPKVKYVSPESGRQYLDSL